MRMPISPVPSGHFNVHLDSITTALQAREAKLSTSSADGFAAQLSSGSKLGLDDRSKRRSPGTSRCSVDQTPGPDPTSPGPCRGSVGPVLVAVPFDDGVQHFAPAPMQHRGLVAV